MPQKDVTEGCHGRMSRKDATERCHGRRKIVQGKKKEKGGTLSQMRLTLG